MNRVTWECFLRDIKTIYNLSRQLNDNWQIVISNDDVAGTYLVKTKSITLNMREPSDEQTESDGRGNDFEEINDQFIDLSSERPLDQSHQQLIRFEYHVLYHISYAVPYLCFNAFKSNGSLLTLDEAWKIFNDFRSNQSNSMPHNMLNVLTQMEHPVLFKPFLTLHPCRIADILQTLPNSQNRVLSFLSIYGPTVYLTFDLEYAKYLVHSENESENKVDE